MKVGIVYTSTTPELTETVNTEVRKQLGDQVELLKYEDPGILSDVCKHGYVTAASAARLISMFMRAVRDGADAVLNVCSSVGEVADCMQNAAKYIGVPIVRIDEEMCKDAVRRAKRIGVMATLPTTLEPTENTLKRLSRELNREVFLVDALVKGAFGLDPENFRRELLEHAQQIKDQIDLLLLCQGSMAYCENYLEESLGIPVLSSPRYGAGALKCALLDKGLIL